MNANPATRKRSFLLVCLWRAKSSEAEILEQKKPRAWARGVSYQIRVFHRFFHYTVIPKEGRNVAFGANKKMSSPRFFVGDLLLFHNDRFPNPAGRRFRVHTYGFVLWTTGFWNKFRMTANKPFIVFPPSVLGLAALSFCCVIPQCFSTDSRRCETTDSR